MGRLRMRIQSQRFLALSQIMELTNSQLWDAFLGIGRVTKGSKAKCTQSCCTEGVDTESDKDLSMCKGLQSFYSENVIIGKIC